MMNHESEGLLRRLSRTLAGLCRGILGGRSRLVPSLGEPEFEPVHGWTGSQRDDYLGRNPAYRSDYERMLRRCNGPLSQSPLVPGALPEAPASPGVPR